MDCIWVYLNFQRLKTLFEVQILWDYSSLESNLIKVPFLFLSLLLTRWICLCKFNTFLKKCLHIQFKSLNLLVVTYYL